MPGSLISKNQRPPTPDPGRPPPGENPRGPKTPNLLTWPGWGGGDRLIGLLGVPEDGDDPPPLAVEEELDAVDAAHKRLFVIILMTRFVGAEDMGDGAKPVDTAVDLLFEESFVLDVTLDRRDELVDGEDASHGGAVGSAAAGDESGPGQEQAAQATPQQQLMADADMLSDLNRMFGELNRQNTSVYPVDPRGLAAFEFDINQGIGIQQDAKSLRDSLDSLHSIAANTDGRAIVNRNDLASGMKQIIRDASGYYLIGYNSSQAPSDGKFHEIKVRVKRPGIQVRARKGYWALTAADTARALAPPTMAPPKPVENALNSALARPSSASVVRTWIGTSRGENGKTRITFVWEPIPKTPGDVQSARSEPDCRCTSHSWSRHRRVRRVWPHRGCSMLYHG